METMLPRVVMYFCPPKRSVADAVHDRVWGLFVTLFTSLVYIIQSALRFGRLAKLPDAERR